jgi:hypothetical protein
MAEKYSRDYFHFVCQIQTSVLVFLFVAYIKDNVYFINSYIEGNLESNIHLVFSVSVAEP